MNHLWKSDVAQSVDMYNNWFMDFAPQAYRDTRLETTKHVKSTLEWTNNLRDITPTILRQYPSTVSMLRMATAPPIARDRLIGLAGVSSNLIDNMENDNRLPPRMAPDVLEQSLINIARIIMRIADRDLFPWLDTTDEPTEQEVLRSATVVADRLCGASTDPIVRNAQEIRQLGILKQWLEAKGYTMFKSVQGKTFADMLPGTFAQRLNVMGQLENEESVGIPIDTVIMPLNAIPGSFPLLIEAKSAGDYTNTNKRRKEEANKVMNLRRKYGSNVLFVLFLCGYFDSGYLGFAASDGIDWVWEHRVDDLAGFGV